MSGSSAQLLEWEELKALIGRYIGGPLGRAELDALEPFEDPAGIDGVLAETAEAMDFTREHGRPPLGGLDDISESVARLRIQGAGLDGEQIAQLTGFLERATETRSLISAQSARFPLLAVRSGRIADFRPLLREVSGKILPNGTVPDDASVALSRLRREIERQGRHIQSSLERFLRTHREEGVLQEEYVAIRNDRFVVPVISGQRRRVEGVIHGASGSGQTLFVEPLETIDLNNELVRLREEEMREVHRILREVTDRLRSQYAEIQATVAEISRMDLLFAKAGFAKDFDCVVPQFSPHGERRLHLRQARHPLLQDVLKRSGARPVPVSLTLDSRQGILLISGPNAGGKTVAMKTVGLLTMMAHAGIPVPADEAVFPLVDMVLADIGDQQSIEQSLSTFSAHVTCIRDMLDQATPDSLVLLDELGRATDPEEGGALGVAILDHFRTLRCFVLASTHLLALKVYGSNTASVLNASMGFDERTLQPTYVLRLGAPGKSAGLDVASRLGMPPALIERARAAMSSTERDISRFLAELHDRLQTTATLQRELTERTEAVRRRQEDLEREFTKKRDQTLKALERKYDEVVANFEARALDTIESIKEIREERKAKEDARLRVSKAKREGKQDLSEAVSEIVPPAEQPFKPQVVEGARVRLKGVREPAKVRRLIDDSIVEVEAGFLKMQVSIDDIEQVLPPEQKAEGKLPKNVTFHQAGPKWDISYREINLLGKRAEEAEEEVDRFLDQAALASIDRVRIVHGFGMGVLKKTVAELLKRHPHVQNYYPASPAEGGGGATIAELKTT
ncbi:MAG TPA: endonuclease MutS2 [Bryobacteraceae bacterium]|nr:endonuclease MutS2 [Bryobacteraceae bacterium]